MTIRVAINGYGRIGRNIMRAHYESGKKHDLQIVAINDLGNAETNAHLTRYDTAHGFAHRDRQHADGSSEKTPLPLEDYRQALNYAEAELKAHWQTYRQQFLEEVEHGPRQ